MQYRKDRYGEPISLLGYGCMRFTKNGNSIDLDKAERELMLAIKSGVNYLDTAYIYPGSEVAVGEILHRNHCREEIRLATKLPQYYIKSGAAIEKYFNEQLTRLQTDYIDYYLMHMLTDVAAWEKLKKLGIEAWITQKKKEGKIRNIGFSFHGNTEMFIQILDAYDWDFCQIQYNYLDEHTQAGREGLLYAESKGIPVIIMEPLRGGRLVQLLPEEAKLLFAEAVPKRTPAEWAFRWLWNQTGVTVVLSGMNSLEMVQQNVQVASESKAGELTGEQMELYEKVRQEINRKIKVGCTACGYCMPCQKGIDIPGTFRCYNELYTGSRKAGKKEYLMTTAFRKKQNPASGCAQCGKCEQHCPQQIPIRQKLKEASRELEDPRYKFMAFVVKHLRIWQ